MTRPRNPKINVEEYSIGELAEVRTQGTLIFRIPGRVARSSQREKGEPCSHPRLGMRGLSTVLDSIPVYWIESTRLIPISYSLPGPFGPTFF